MRARPNMRPAATRVVLPLAVDNFGQQRDQMAHVVVRGTFAGGAVSASRGGGCGENKSFQSSLSASISVRQSKR